MESPISPLFADIFMSRLEKKMLQVSISKNHVIFWCRYVEDILTTFERSPRQLSPFLNYINGIHSKMVIENNRKINFLDLTLNRTGNATNFSLFHQKTFTGTTIPIDSNHP